MGTRKSLRRQVLRILLLSDLEHVSADAVARRLYVSQSTLRRRLKSENTSYQQLLDRVRCYRCEKALARRWLPGKSIAAELGFTQPNSFYRAFGRWTGMTFTQYKRLKQQGSVSRCEPLY